MTAVTFRCTRLAWRVGLASQDRDAGGGWIEGRADRRVGKRILGDLPRLPRGEGDLWAPGHGILDRVACPAIRTFDSSRTPKRGERLATRRTLAESLCRTGSCGQNSPGPTRGSGKR